MKSCWHELLSDTKQLSVSVVLGLPCHIDASNVVHSKVHENKIFDLM